MVDRLWAAGHGPGLRHHPDQFCGFASPYSLPTIRLYRPYAFLKDILSPRGEVVETGEVAMRFGRLSTSFSSGARVAFVVRHNARFVSDGQRLAAEEDPLRRRAPVASCDASPSHIGRPRPALPGPDVISESRAAAGARADGGDAGSPWAPKARDFWASKMDTASRAARSARSLSSSH